MGSTRHSLLNLLPCTGLLPPIPPISLPHPATPAPTEPLLPTDWQPPPPRRCTRPLAGADGASRSSIVSSPALFGRRLSLAALVRSTLHSSSSLTPSLLESAASLASGGRARRWRRPPRQIMGEGDESLTKHTAVAGHHGHHDSRWLDFLVSA
jgi:hypothetical protein